MSDIKLPCDKHETQIIGLDKRCDSIEHKVNDLSDMKNAVTRLVTLQEESEKRDIQRDIDIKQQAAILVKFENTLTKVNANLDNLNAQSNEANKRIGNLEQKVNEQTINSIKKTSWDFIDFAKGGIGILIGGGIVYYVTTLIK